jgi:hypothetical protein
VIAFKRFLEAFSGESQSLYFRSDAPDDNSAVCGESDGWLFAIHEEMLCIHFVYSLSGVSPGGVLNHR